MCPVDKIPKKVWVVIPDNAIKNSPEGEFLVRNRLRNEVHASELHRLHLLDEGLECVRVLHRELGEDFPVEFDVLLLL